MNKLYQQIFQARVAGVFILGLSLILCSSCKPQSSTSSGSGSGSNTAESLKELARIRNSGVIEDKDHATIIKALDSGSSAEKTLALSMINKNPSACCFAVPSLVSFLTRDDGSSARVLAIRTLGELGACARPGEGVLRAIADGMGTEATIAQHSLRKISASK